MRRAQSENIRNNKDSSEMVDSSNLASQPVYSKAMKRRRRSYAMGDGLSSTILVFLVAFMMLTTFPFDIGETIPTDLESNSNRRIIEDPKGDIELNADIEKLYDEIQDLRVNLREVFVLMERAEQVSFG